MKGEESEVMPTTRPLSVGMVGPSAIGKTSIIAALLHEARQVLEGTTVKAVPAGDTTMQIDFLVQRLKTHIKARRFDPIKGIAGSSGINTFRLDLCSATMPDAHVKVEIADYPGSWLEDPSKSPDWGVVSADLRQANMLIVPVDATLLMEARLSSHDAIVRAVSYIEAVERVVEAWAASRHSQAARCSLALVPVRCESYFSDNGGRVDKSAELEARTRDMYQPVIRSAEKNHPAVDVVYCPVDTMGCVELQRVHWSSPRPDLRFNIRGSNPELSPRGAGDIFVQLVDGYLTELEEVRNKQHHEATEAAARARHRANRDNGWFGNFIDWLDGTQAAREELAKTLSREAKEKADALLVLGRTLQEVRARPASGRLKWISARAPRSSR